MIGPQIPPGVAERTLRQQVAINAAAGYSPLRARLAVLDTLRVRAAREYQHLLRAAEQHPAGAYRRQKDRAVEACRAWWTEMWNVLGLQLDAGLEEEAAGLIDSAIARLEPWQEPAAGGPHD